MSTKLKLYLGKKISNCLHKYTKFTATQVQPLIEIDSHHTDGKIELTVPLNLLEAQLGVTNINEILKIEPDDIIKKVHVTNYRANRAISFEIDKSMFIKDVIENCADPELNFTPHNYVIEFSSPNVAKPFHLGHLRSTIIGNFLSNLNLFVKNSVTRLNYLGDWGTQFGFIKVGFKELQISPETLQKEPVKSLYDSYVHANKLAESDPLILERAKEEFAKLERGVPEDVKHWNEFMNFTRTDLASTYSRLGVVFDEYNYESMYSSKRIQEILAILRKKRIIVKENDGKEVAKIDAKRQITVVKSDGSSLYITRDIAAAIDRYNRYKFDKMFYVVENGQNDHFYALRYILNRMDLPWAHRLVHVKFGRIHGMSTRKGTAVFLKDILNESKAIMIERQMMSPTTKVPITNEDVSETLGISCVIINDLKQRRQKDYGFDWDRILQVKGDTGIKLQYTHCRLYGLEQNSGATIAHDLNPSLLMDDPEIIILLKELSRFQNVLHNANDQLEACILVNYLLHLCNQISKTLSVVKVKGADPEIASQRLLVFHTAKTVLKNGMLILGLKPLNEM